jgi:ATP-dependent DNA helicase DinG
MKSEQKLTDNVREKLVLAIQDALGQEILAIGQLDAFGSVSEIHIAARGDFSSVPALRPFMNKGDIVLHNHPSGDLRPSSADLQIASELGNEGIGFYIVDNTVTSLYAVAEPYVVQDNTQIDADRLAGILAPEGALGRAYSYYEYRESQIAMLDAVAESFNEDKIVAVEAGTGVGKSLAYLLPAFEWAAVNEERIVISTATINLQQQLIDKDIPLVQGLLSRNIKTALVKGRANYLCIRRLEEALEENVLFMQMVNRIPRHLVSSDPGEVA